FLGLTALLLLVAPLAAVTGTGTHFRDDFRTDTLSAYTCQGDVAWQNGTVTLAAAARLTRSLPLGLTAELVGVVRLPPGTPDAEAALASEGPPLQVTVTLRRQGGKLLLVNQAGPGEEVTLATAAKEDTWAVRCRLHYGLVRIRAWPADGAEPQDWSSVRYAGA